MTDLRLYSRAGRREVLALVLLSAWGVMGCSGSGLAQPAGGAAPAPQAASEGRAGAETPSTQWQELRPLVVERVFRGPLRDTVVQRLRDPVDGSTCFMYLPMSAAIAAQGQFLVYGPNAIGSISCFGPAHVIQLQQAAPAAPAASAPAAPAANRSR